MFSGEWENTPVTIDIENRGRAIDVVIGPHRIRAAPSGMGMTQSNETGCGSARRYRVISVASGSEAREACEARTPGLHPMCGRYAVRECGTAVGQTAPRYFWA